MLRYPFKVTYELYGEVYTMQGLAFGEIDAVDQVKRRLCAAGEDMIVMSVEQV